MHFFSVLDLVVISVSLYFELRVLYVHETHAETWVGITILARVWHFVRVGHGE